MRVLVTGCGGFLGAEVVRQLLARGDDVVGLGRRDYPQLAEAGMQQVRGDIRNQTAVLRATEDVDAVIHTAAIAGVWGSYQRYFETNTLGTRHVIDACHQREIGSLVFCSSPSVTFGGDDQTGVDESEPYPNDYLCHYPRTKAAAEQEVLAANQPGRLLTCALRPHLIWAPDDPHLFPRLIQRARAGRLVRVGSGENLIDTIHVRNAAHAHLLALDRISGGATEAAGRAYFLSQGEPVACWAWLSEILTAAGVDVPTRSISYRTAYRIGHGLELLYAATRRTSEPPMTRFVAAQLAKDHYFDITAARRLLGYEPILSTAEGLAELKSQWRN
ncbi:3 beta-hydroxysteroid dehydrogenase/Delta 5--_4-isomerase [Rosistilla carotiformis]|uniref:3 beta-hydroxysteroid dehydrogenase/Delta 5-->4-isomerase n=1 Tax=Rosistilla carotiformis TaxID=2528017 RepID=A0A518JQD5_9BACT|nr:NAD-dependent epimerase/dehydratase family protein [Rosistilla carotiformis]QDV67751.1 3 beta-hydroxysteroid dehydrogenase/Delta 5-->4-isomerase [Rosistilla carotiformis]